VFFALVNNSLWGHVRIEILYLALFPLRIPHPNTIKTRNPAPARNCNSRFPPPFSAQIPNIAAKKSQIPHHQTYWGPSKLKSRVYLRLHLVRPYMMGVFKALSSFNTYTRIRFLQRKKKMKCVLVCAYNKMCLLNLDLFNDNTKRKWLAKMRFIDNE